MRRRAAPAAAIFAMMTKVGVYAMLRLCLLLFGRGRAVGGLRQHAAAGRRHGDASPSAPSACWPRRTCPRLAGFSVLVSSGTLLAAIGSAHGAVTGGALFYLVSSTLAIGAFFLLIELVSACASRAPTCSPSPRRPMATATRTT